MRQTRYILSGLVLNKFIASRSLFVSTGKPLLRQINPSSWTDLQGPSKKQRCYAGSDKGPGSPQTAITFSWPCPLLRNQVRSACFMYQQAIVGLVPILNQHRGAGAFNVSVVYTLPQSGGEVHKFKIQGTRSGQDPPRPCSWASEEAREAKPSPPCGKVMNSILP